MNIASTVCTRTRRRAGLLALVLFALGAIGAPVVDAWLHADDAAAAVQGRGVHECVVCRLAATPAESTPTTDSQIRTGIAQYHPRFAPVTTRLRAPTARLTPPTRAPPA